MSSVSPGGETPLGRREVVEGDVVTEVHDAEVLEGRVLEPVDLVAAAVLAVPGVSSLHAGLAGSAATFLPGRRVAGIALRPTGTEVHVVVAFGADVRATAQAVHEAVTALGGVVPRPVHVHVEDLAAP